MRYAPCSMPFLPATRNTQRGMDIIEFENLCHRFADGTSGIEDINLNIREGSFVVIAGPNGSGKTTLLRHLNGLLTPTSGIVRLAGIPVEQNLLRARQLVGMMFQDADSQIVGETVYEDVAQFGVKPQDKLKQADAGYPANIINKEQPCCQYK